MKHLPPAPQETHKVPRLPAQHYKAACQHAMQSQKKPQTQERHRFTDEDAFFSITLVSTPVHTSLLCTPQCTMEKKALGDSVGFVMSDSQSSLVTSTPEISTSCPSIVPWAKLQCCFKGVNIHPFQRRGDCYTESICNLRWAGEEHGIDWFWPFPRQNLLFAFSSK